jgi:hypothetical protein
MYTTYINPLLVQARTADMPYKGFLSSNALHSTYKETGLRQHDCVSEQITSHFQKTSV